uniref:Uncharacterized protein n=1 Tax=Rhodosorus marinus TaxID=101924 RepID=A0A7S2ZDX1_9RHOD|mmetsp:Transcript_15362/g.62672  ORF Transcript_15362/g.62672 Transcript_15362/m.62672 type:complete len:347 (+) Transcript_15362:96-1136(+)
MAVYDFDSIDISVRSPFEEECILFERKGAKAFDPNVHKECFHMRERVICGVTKPFELAEHLVGKAPIEITIFYLVRVLSGSASLARKIFNIVMEFPDTDAGVTAVFSACKTTSFANVEQAMRTCRKICEEFPRREVRTAIYAAQRKSITTRARVPEQLLALQSSVSGLKKDLNEALSSYDAYLEALNEECARVIKMRDKIRSDFTLQLEPYEEIARALGGKHLIDRPRYLKHYEDTPDLQDKVTPEGYLNIVGLVKGLKVANLKMEKLPRLDPESFRGFISKAKGIGREFEHRVSPDKPKVKIFSMGGAELDSELEGYDEFDEEILCMGRGEEGFGSTRGPSEARH